MSRLKTGAITFVLTAEEVVINKTIKFTANVQGIIQKNSDREKLAGKVKAMLKNFIEGEWQLSNIQRDADPVGLERLSLTATLRADEKENYNLQERYRAVSTNDGDALTITNCDSDATTPLAELEKVESNLRIAILDKAQNECNRISAATNIRYVVHDVNFQQITRSDSSNRMRAITATATAMNYGKGLNDDDGTFGSAAKISTSATITLAKYAEKYADTTSNVVTD